MPDSPYPLIRRRPRRAWPDRRRLARVLAFLVLGSLLVAGVAVARRPRAATAAELLADARRTLAAGNYSAARRNAERAVAADPASVAAQLALARAALAQDDGLAAEAALGRAGGGPPQLRAHALLLQGDVDGALGVAATATDRNYADRVRALALAGRDPAAGRTLLEALVARVPDEAAAWTALARLRLAAGDLGGAAQAAAAAVRRSPREPAALTVQGEVVRARYGPVAALPWFAAALATDAYYAPALVEQAATLGDAGRYRDALAATRALLAARPGSGPALYLQAVIAARAGRAELAERLLGAADALPGALLIRGALDEGAGREELATARWRRLVELQPMNVAARRLLGGVLLRAGDTAGALAVLRPVVLRADADAYSLRLAGRAWEAAGDRQAAAAFLDRAAGGSAGASALFATDEAVAALTAGAAAAPADPTWALGLIRGLAGAGDRAGALARARALAVATPGAPAAQQVLGDVLAAGGDWRGAAAAYQRAANLRFDEPAALRLVDALGRAGRGADAAAALALYLRQNPQSLPARRLLGRWQVAAGRWDAAIETLEGVRRRGGGRDAALLADLSLAYAGAGDGAVARRYGAAAYALQPMSAAVCDGYGAALAADGAVAAARQLLDKAAALAPGDPAIAEHRRRLALEAKVVEVSGKQTNYVTWLAAYPVRRA